MKFNLIICTLLIFVKSNSQNWNKYSDSIFSNYKENKIEKAKHFINLTEEEIKKSTLIIDTIYADFLYRKGIVYLENEDCITNFNESLRIWNKSRKKNYYKIMKIYYFIGIHYFNKKEDEKAIINFEECFYINIKKNLKSNPNFINSLKILSLLYFEANDYKNAGRIADEYIKLNKEFAFINFDFDFVKMYQYKNDEKTQENILLQYLDKYNSEKIDNPAILAKINFELLLFYDTIKREKDVYKSIYYGEKVLELYFKYKVLNLSEIKLTIKLLITQYINIGSVSQELYLKKIEKQLFPNEQTYYDYFDRLNYHLLVNDYDKFLKDFSKYENELKEKNDIDNLIKIYYLSLDSFERDFLFSKSEINSQFDFIKNNLNFIKENEFYALYLTEYYTNVEINYNLVREISSKNLKTPDLKLKLVFYFLLINSEINLNLDSEDNFKKFIELIDTKLDVFDKDYDKYLFELVKIYENNKNRNFQKTLHQKLLISNYKLIDEITNYYNDSEITNYIKSNRFKEYYFLSIILKKEISLVNYIFNYSLLLKNLSLRNQQRIKTTIEKNGDANLKEKYQQFIDNKRYITKIEELPAAQRPASYNQLKIETESLEKELTRLSATFADAKKSLSVSWKEIQQQLKPNEVVIDLVSFNYYNNKWTDSIMYGAFVIKKDSKFPKFINLFEEKQLSVLLNRNSKAHDSIQSKIINKQYSDKEISDLFYKPLEAELKNGNTIYLAPSGLAHQINFKALPINDNQTLGEKFKVILLGTTAALIDYKPTAFNKTNDFEMILYGGIDYNKKEVEVNKETYPNVLNDLATRSGITEFNYLPGTNEEVNKINKEAISYNLKTTIKTERAATEESVKQLSGKANPFILHLATHGYFFENIKQELSDFDKNIPEEAKKRIYLASEDPMMRSGLLLAGANNSWRKTNNETNTDDGILTAKEIANLDLSSCKLVVLSACETGLGQINGSEGVFGLQRAFKMAGVQNIIMSLWKVPDAQTAELFEIFYTECFNGKSITDAFQLAQSKMKAKYPPYFWSGFVLLE